MVSRRQCPIYKALSEPTAPAADPDQELLESVRDNLQVLLNTRQGSVPHLPDYGLPDLSQVFAHAPECLEYLRQSVLIAIRRYEPRLANVQVSTLEGDDDDDLGVSFRIEGHLRLPSAGQITYRTTFRDVQEVEVHRVEGVRY